MSKPLDGILVLDFTQLLSGPSATLRLHDLGARVIKVEHHEKGDLSRSIYATHFSIGNESAFFQATNRGKESLCANLKNEEDLAMVRKIARQADIVVHNFRPGVMTRLGLGYKEISELNPEIIFGAITGYGSAGPWRNKPGQDLLLQALSGLTGLSGADADGPVPMGLAVADILAGAQLVQGILAAMVGGRGALVEVSMLEAILDFQFEPLTLYFQDGQPIVRGNNNAAHPLVGAPYGLYKTQDSYIALAMGAIPRLGELLGCQPLLAYTDSGRWYAQRDEIKSLLAGHLAGKTSAHWLSILEPADIWCANVLNWQELVEHEGFKVLDMLQTVRSQSGESYVTTRCPIRLDDMPLFSAVAAPALGEHSETLRDEFG